MRRTVAGAALGAGIAALIAGATDPAQAQNEIIDGINGMCAQVWANSYRTQLRCRENEYRAALWFMDLQSGRAATDPLITISEACLVLWHDRARAPSYVAARRCTESEIAAYEALHRK